MSVCPVCQAPWIGVPWSPRPEMSEFFISSRGIFTTCPTDPAHTCAGQYLDTARAFLAKFPTGWSDSALRAHMEADEAAP